MIGQLKKYIFFSLFLILSLFTVISSTEDKTLEEFLPIGLTEYERQHLDKIGINHINTPAPLGIVRNPSEWEPSTGVIIRWPLGIPYSLIADMSDDLMVTTIVGSSSQETSARNSYISNGVNMSNTQFLIAPTNSIWTRDYGPWFIYQDNKLAIVDPIYNRPRPQDDIIPQFLADVWRLNIFGLDLRTPGGNHMSDGLSNSMSTKLVYNENTDKTHAEIDSLMLAFLGNDYTVLDYIESGGIHHLDCWAKFLSPTTILVKDVPQTSSSYNLLNDRAEQLSQQISAWGQPYTIVRIYCPYGTAYTNSIILNKRVYVPLFGGSYDAVAIQTYEDAMPGYEVLGYYGSWLDDDAIHCRAMGVPDDEVLFIDHIPLAGQQSRESDFPISAFIIPYSETGLISDSLKVYYRIDGGVLEQINFNQTSNPDSFYCEIPTTSSGNKITYFIKAADNSGRVETHPFIGESWAHSFIINTTPVIISDDSLNCKSSSYFAFSPDYFDPDDDNIIIMYSNYPSWLAVVNDSLVGTAPDERIFIDFKVNVADEYSMDSLDVSVFIYICGDVNGDSVGPIISDLTYLVDYLFGGGLAPPDTIAADIDGSTAIGISDITSLVDYLFRGGPPPICE